jgi:hypothetical protein
VILVEQWTKGEMAVGLVLVAVAITVAMNLPELRRYLQIRSM